MKKFRFLLILILSMGLTTSCDKPNVLTEYSKTDSDEALYIDAKKKIDDLQWQEALDIINNEISASYRSHRDVQNTLAGAYAGKCGLTFFDLVDGITNNANPVIFPFFMGLFASKTLDVASCDQAIAIMQGIGTVAQRTNTENLYLALLGVTRIGTTLSSKLDQAPSNGAMDSGSTVCHNNASGAQTDGWAALYQGAPFNFPTAPGAMTHYLTDAEVKKVIVGLGLIFENTGALTAAIGGGSNSTLTGLDTAKTACAAAISAITGGTVSSCEFTTSAAVPSELVYAFRLMLQSADFGFSTCDIDDNVAYAASLAAYIANPDANHDGIPDTPPSMPANYCCPSTTIPGI